MPQTVKVEEVIEFIFVQAEQQLILVAEVESLKCRKEAFELLLEENKQLLAQERRRIRKIELEKAEIGELESKLRCEAEHLRKVVVQLNERISVLLGESEQLKKREVERDVKLKEAEIVLKHKWELERQELQLRVSELEVSQQLRRTEQLVSKYLWATPATREPRSDLCVCMSLHSNCVHVLKCRNTMWLASITCA